MMAVLPKTGPERLSFFTMAEIATHFWDCALIAEAGPQWLRI